VSDHGVGDLSWTQWAIGGVAAGGALVTGWLLGAIGGVRDKAASDIEKVRKDGEAERDAIWERLNRHLEDDERIHREAERYFASKDDIKEVKALIAESEGRIIEAIGERGPIRERR
jgi:hypothetical protein